MNSRDFGEPLKRHFLAPVRWQQDSRPLSRPELPRALPWEASVRIGPAGFQNHTSSPSVPPPVGSQVESAIQTSFPHNGRAECNGPGALALVFPGDPLKERAASCSHRPGAVHCSPRHLGVILKLGLFLGAPHKLAGPRPALLPSAPHLNPDDKGSVSNCAQGAAPCLI